jgi:putative transposase
MFKPNKRLSEEFDHHVVKPSMQLEGWQINHKRVKRIWRKEGLKVPKKKPKRGRLWLNNGSCLRLRPVYSDHDWGYDFVLERTHAGCAFRILNLFDEYTQECLAIRVERNLDHGVVQECLAELFCICGVPAHLRSDNGPEFIANQLRLWLNRLGVKTLFTEPGSPWENGYIESFNGRMHDELLDREIFFALEEAKTLIARWREEYNHIRPHSALGYCPPAPQAWLLAQPPVSTPGLT